MALMSAIYFKMFQQYIHRKVKNERFTVANLGEGFSLYYSFNLSKIKKKEKKKKDMPKEIGRASCRERV